MTLPCFKNRHLHVVLRPSSIEGQYDSDQPILSRKEKTGKRDSSLERVDKGIDRGASLRYPLMKVDYRLLSRSKSLKASRKEGLSRTRGGEVGL
jgi:hypothetical protein